MSVDRVPCPVCRKVMVHRTTPYCAPCGKRLANRQAQRRYKVRAGIGGLQNRTEYADDGLPAGPPLADAELLERVRPDVHTVVMLRLILRRGY